MTVRALAADMDDDVVRAIDARLAAVAVDHGVVVPWAIESGSRAWGFPSPDSDYDCRFFYVRPVDDYAAPWRPRDVIETPLDAVLDVNGWDLVKAVRLAVAGNATVGEWLRSPLIYHGEQEFHDELLALVTAVPAHAARVRHYLHVGRAQWTRAGADRVGTVPLKRVFYALRPALVLHWTARHTDPRDAVGAVAPMDVGELIAQAPPPAAVVDEVRALIALKATTRELGDATVPPAIRAFVTGQFADAHDRLGTLAAPDPASARAAATVRFLDLVRRWAP